MSVLMVEYLVGCVGGVLGALFVLAIARNASQVRFGILLLIVSMGMLAFGLHEVAS